MLKEIRPGWYLMVLLAFGFLGAWATTGQRHLWIVVVAYLFAFSAVFFLGPKEPRS